MTNAHFLKMLRWQIFLWTKIFMWDTCHIEHIWCEVSLWKADGCHDIINNNLYFPQIESSEITNSGRKSQTKTDIDDMCSQHQAKVKIQCKLFLVVHLGALVSTTISHFSVRTGNLVVR